MNDMPTGILTITVFVAAWNNPAQGRGVVVARIPTTREAAPTVFAQWQTNNLQIGARPGQYNSPFEASFQQHRESISDY